MMSREKMMNLINYQVQDGVEGSGVSGNGSDRVVRTTHVTEKKGLLNGSWITPVIDTGKPQNGVVSVEKSKVGRPTSDVSDDDLE